MTIDTPAPSDEWVTPSEPTEPSPDRPGRWQRSRRWVAAGGLVVAGLAAGVGIGFAINHSAGNDGHAVVGSANGNGVPDGNGVPGYGFPGDGDGQRGGQNGGQDGEQHVQGTITAISGSQLTVKTSAGSATYPVSSSTQILRNGAAATLSQLRTGDPVEVHVFADGTVERVIAGTAPQGR